MALTSMLPARAQSDAEVIRGFNLTVFGSEISTFDFQGRYIRKFPGEVRFKIHNLSTRDRTTNVTAFINSLERSIFGLETRIVDQAAAANFNLYIVDRDDYAKIVREKVNRPGDRKVRGTCLVRSQFSRFGIRHSDAVIVSDLGESLFQRCMIEEILQGLGPLNESTSLAKSIFNDASKHTSFTNFDRLILNMLYDKRIRNGVPQSAVSKLLPRVLEDVRTRTGISEGQE